MFPFEIKNDFVNWQLLNVSVIVMVNWCLFVMCAKKIIDTNFGNLYTGW